MSNIAQAWAWQTSIRGVPKFVLVALADHADDEGICWPGIRGLARKCGVTDRTIQNSIKTFIAQGLVTVEKRERPDHSRTSNIYHLEMELGSPYGELHSPGGVAVSPPPGELHSPPGETSGGTRTLIEPSVMNPSLTPAVVKKKRTTEVTPEFRQAMKNRFGPTLGATVDERINEALAHKSATKWTDLQSYVTKWLRGDSEKKAAPQNGRYPPRSTRVELVDLDTKYSKGFFGDGKK